MKRLLIPFFVVVFFAFGAIAANAQTTYVTPATPGTWYFWNDLNDTATGITSSFVNGPATPPMGAGSVYMQSLDGTERQGLATNAYVGTRLDAITKLQYSSYQTGPTLAIALQFDIKYRPADVSYGGRLVYEPYQQTGTVASGWQTWDALPGKWWASKTTAAGSNGLCPQATPCTLATILAAYPDAVISGRTIFRTGAWTGFTGNVDAFIIGVNNVNATYDFEVTVPDTTPPPMPVHLSPANNTVTTTAAQQLIDWTDVVDDSSNPVVYYYESSLSSATNPDGSFVSPVYQSGALSTSQIPTPGTPEGVYYWHVRAVDAVGNSSAWTSAWKITVSNAPPPPPVATNMNQCKNGGWAIYVRANGTPFKNQGDCVSYTQNGK
ncbi:MAG TPA: hypothetical protein VHQ20_00395 [Patescibacteria group bacterium]|jgi:hypothetical protein|nr:hypothetical protein [Patescibacteria group bacterium]